MRLRMMAFAWVSIAAGLVFTGCGSSTESAKRPEIATSSSRDEAGKDTAAADSGSKASQSADNKPFKLGDMVQPFTPPKFEELEKTVEWVDRPVVDSLKLLRDKQTQEKPLATVAEALKLKNDSDADNNKILSAMGRLPARDGEVNWDAEINRRIYGDANSTNPILTSSVVESDINQLHVFELFNFDWNMNPFATAETVKTWQSSKDAMFDKVVLRDDQVWSDGKPITAHDVAFSFLAIMSSKVPVMAVRSGTDKLKWVEAYDDRTVVFFHQEPLATNVWNINFPVIPKHVYEPTIAQDPTLVNIPEHVTLENKPISGGPYVIRSRTRGQEIIFERREDYYMHNGKQVRDKPYFKTMRFRIRPEPSTAILSLKAGDIDEMELTPEQWRTQTNDADFYRTATKVRAAEWTSFFFQWNCKTPFFSDKRVRTAMTFAYDHDELLKRLRYGLDQPANGPFHPTSKWSPQPPLPFAKQNLDKAEELLDQAGWKDTDGDGIRDKMIDGRRVPFEFTVLVVNAQDRIDVCTLLKQCLDQIGVRCDIKPLEFAALIEKMQTHDFQATYAGWGTGTDPDLTDNIFGTGHDRNYGYYSNPEVDRLYEAGRKELDPAKRPAIYQQIYRQLNEDQPYTWLFYRNSYYGFNRSLRGYIFSPRGPYHYGPGIHSIWKPTVQ